MNTINFQWDKNKNHENIRKYKISFEEAKTIFYDENSRLIADPGHSIKEERFIILGLSGKLNLLVVVHTYKSNDNIIRIISARKAIKSEINYYNEVK